MKETNTSLYKYKNSRKIKYFIKTRFRPGDYFITFTYQPNEQPKNIDEAMRQWRNFLNRIRDIYKKENAEFIRTWALENKNNRFYFYLLIKSGVNIDIFGIEWEHGFVRVEILNDSTFQFASDYITKKH